MNELNNIQKNLESTLKEIESQKNILLGSLAAQDPKLASEMDSMLKKVFAGEIGTKELDAFYKGFQERKNKK